MRASDVLNEERQQMAKTNRQHWSKFKNFQRKDSSSIYIYTSLLISSVWSVNDGLSGNLQKLPRPVSGWSIIDGPHGTFYHGKKHHWSQKISFYNKVPFSVLIYGIYCQKLQMLLGIHYGPSMMSQEKDLEKTWLLKDTEGSWQLLWGYFI